MIADAINKYSTGEHRFFEEIFTEKAYFEADKAPKKDIVIDVGANRGFFSFWVYDQVQEIYAVEANQTAYDRLIADVSNHDLNKIKPYHLAIGGEKGKRKLYECGGDGGHSIVTTNGQVLEEVDTVTLYQFMEQEKINHVDLMKIDVECAETEIFSAPDFIKAAKRINFIIGELHTGQDKAIEKLQEAGYKVENKTCIFIAYK